MLSDKISISQSWVTFAFSAVRPYKISGAATSLDVAFLDLEPATRGRERGVRNPRPHLGKSEEISKYIVSCYERSVDVACAYYV